MPRRTPSSSVAPSAWVSLATTFAGCSAKSARRPVRTSDVQGGAAQLGADPRTHASATEVWVMDRG